MQANQQNLILILSLEKQGLGSNEKFEVILGQFKI